MSVSINADDKLWVKSVVDAAMAACVIPAANCNYQQKTALATAVAAAIVASDAVT